MIVAGMALHVGRLGHVAINALISSAVRSVETVRLWCDDGCRGEASASGVTAYAEIIAR